MQLPRFYFLPLVASLALCSSSSFGMKVESRSLKDVAAGSAVGVVADILDAPQIRDDRFTHMMTLRVEVVSTVYGGTVEPGGLTCRYEEGRPHQRGNMRVWPLISGSGMEWEIKKSQRVILMLKHHPAMAPDCEVLRMEPIENQDAVETAGHRGCCRNEPPGENPATP